MGELAVSVVGELLERERELDTIDAALAGGAVLFEGSAGIGKSVLLDVAEQRAAARGLVVLRARGSVLEREFGFGAALQLFEPALAVARPDVLTGQARLAAPLFDGDAVASPGSDPFALIHGLY